jgi:hypothetical protein
MKEREMGTRRRRIPCWASSARGPLCRRHQSKAETVSGEAFPYRGNDVVASVLSQSPSSTHGTRIMCII